MKIKFLFSGSSGNCTLIQSDDKKTNIIIDVGVTMKKIKEKLKETEDEEIDIQAIFITHEHSDHVHGLGPFGRFYKCPIYIHPNSYEKISNSLENCNIVNFEGGEEIEIGTFKIKSFSTKHDSASSQGYTIYDSQVNKKFGFLTDTGVFTPLMTKELKTCDACFIEADFDEEELEKFAEYDEFLKDRIRSPLGHLSNQKTLNYANEVLNLSTLEFLALGHLSKNTNSPETVKKRINEIIPSEYTNKIVILDNSINLTLGNNDPDANI